GCSSASGAPTGRAAAVEPAWGWRSLAGSSRRTVAGFGPRTAPRAAPASRSRCRSRRPRPLRLRGVVRLGLEERDHLGARRDAELALDRAEMAADGDRGDAERGRDLRRARSAEQHLDDLPLA